MHLKMRYRKCIHGLCTVTVFTKDQGANVVTYLSKLLTTAARTLTPLKRAGLQVERYISFFARSSTVLGYHRQYHGKHNKHFEPGGLLGAARALQTPLSLGNTSCLESAAHSGWKRPGGPLHRKMPTELALWSMARTLMHPWPNGLF